MASIHFSPHFVLAQQAEGTRRSYEATFIHTNAAGEETVLRFNAHRRLLGKAEGGVFICELRRDAVAPDDAGTHNTLDDLAARCGAVLYPMPVRLHTAGHVLGLSADPDLPRRWAAEKETLEHLFAGDGAAAYIAAMDRQVATPVALSAAVCETLFFQTFFAPLYQPYGTGEAFPCTLYYRVAPGAPSVAFDCMLRIEKDLHEGGGAVVTIEGRCAGGQSLQALLAGQSAVGSADMVDDPVDGRISLRYLLQPRTHALLRLEGSIELTEEGGPDDEEGPALIAAVEIMVNHLPEADMPGPAVLPVLHTEETPKKRWHFF